MGTVVFPNADVKFFLTASNQARAVRRHAELVMRAQLQSQGSEGLPSVQEVAEQLEMRDKRDSSRDVAPLAKAEDAEILDSSELSIDQVVERAVGFVQQKLP